MTPETPLAEVAKFLEPHTAELLVYMHPEAQTLVLQIVRHTMIEWEQSDTCLDPITLGTKLHDLVVDLSF